ncbi:MAG: hypothetical protein BGO57_05330 [Sphingomonadales bacterium 63-6]|nr:MAG: hypothetical protein BGO57_05330 [Sphingomonadales bacterium 63-6]
MRRLLAIGLALLGLGVPLLAAEPVEQPPVEKVKNADTGEALRRQVWEVGRRDVAPAKATIRAQYYGWLSIDERGPEAGIGRVSCPIAESGRVTIAPGSCRVSCEGADIAYNSHCGDGVRSLVDVTSIEWPDFPAIDDKLKRQKVQRWAIAEIALDPATRPHVDLSHGDMVDVTSVVDVKGQDFTLNYPARAMRENAGGTLTLLCQVQADLSSVCRMESFVPPENAYLFEGSVGSLSLRLKARPQLPDGTSSVGKRFKFRASFHMD